MVRKSKKRRWRNEAPKGKQRSSMLRNCGKKCFLGPRSNPKSFPICTKNTCKINRRGVQAAYIRSRQWGKSRSTYKSSRPQMLRREYTRIARKAKRLLRIM